MYLLYSFHCFFDCSICSFIIYSLILKSTKLFLYNILRFKDSLLVSIFISINFVKVPKLLHQF